MSDMTIRRTTVSLPLLHTQIDDNATYRFSTTRIPAQPRDCALNSLWSGPVGFQVTLEKLESDAPIPPTRGQYTGAQIKQMRALETLFTTILNKDTT